MEDWEISPSKLKLLDKKLGDGQFGIVRQAILTGDKGGPEKVAVKTLKGTNLSYINLPKTPFATRCQPF